MLTRPPIPTQSELSILIENSMIKEMRAWRAAARKIRPFVQESARQHREAFRAVGEACARLKAAGVL